jgi:hypothetical protein
MKKIFFMNKSQRIQLNVNALNEDKHIKVQLEQNVNTLEFLSMSIDTKDVYQDFNADYGVLVGRVIANSGIGVPNAKISVFIPLTDEDAENSEIFGIYPYKTPRDKNNEGRRYNLLPRVGKKDIITGIISPKQPFGSFPIKEEIVTNEPFLNVYKKYYKYTALTNNAGDYMIFGVPIGTQTVHLSVDITDIGKYSMTPAAMVTNLGYSPNLFTENNSKIKPSNDLNDLPHIETQEISVDIIPFWGDTENFTIGITRQDFRIRAVLTNTFTIFGSVFTDGNNTMWSAEYTSEERISEYFRASHPSQALHGVYNKRIGIVTEKIYYYPADISDAEIDMGQTKDDGSDMVLLDKSEYSVYKRDGDFVVIVSCNRNKIITDELGNPVFVDNDSVEGIFTKFRGFITLELSSEFAPLNFSTNVGQDVDIVPLRYKLKFPQYANQNQGFEPPNESNGVDSTRTNNWRKQHKVFESGKYYSVAKFHGITFNNWDGNDNQQTDNNGFFIKDIHNNLTSDDRNNNVGILVTETDGIYLNGNYQFPSNGVTGLLNAFGAAWLNLTVHFSQVGYSVDGWEKMDYVRTNDNFSHQKREASNKNLNNYFIHDNTQPIAGGDFNTKWFARSDVHWTDIIEVPITDILTMKEYPSKGFTSTNLSDLDGAEYRNGDYKPSNWTVTDAAPLNGQKINGIPTNGKDYTKYFYKGWGSADCVDFLAKLGII